MILIFAIGFLSLAVGAVGAVACFNKYRKGSVVIAVTSAMIVIMLFGTLMIQLENATKNSLTFAVVGNNKRDMCEIYHDTTDDTFFTLETNTWNIFNIYDRVYLEKNEVDAMIAEDKTSDPTQ
jgi:hypothetical protein